MTIKLPGDFCRKARHRAVDESKSLSAWVAGLNNFRTVLAAPGKKDGWDQALLHAHLNWSTSLFGLGACCGYPEKILSRGVFARDGSAIWAKLPQRGFFAFPSVSRRSFRNYPAIKTRFALRIAHGRQKIRSLLIPLGLVRRVARGHGCQLTDEVATLAAKVDQHLLKMGHLSGSY